MHHRRPAVAAAGALTLAASFLLAVQPATAAPVSAVEREFTERTPERYRDQQLAWAPCSAGQVGFLSSLAGGLECAQVAVPRDWDAPEDGDPLQVTVSREPRQGPRPERTIITNPGGPGGAGLSLAALGSSVPALAGTEVIGLDVRGTGASSALTCGAAVPAGQTAPDVRDRSPQALALAAQQARTVAQVCGADPLADVVDTRQTVYDIDLVRDALDRETIDWVGYSGGTWLGTQYATHLPGRVGRFVLDSTVDATAGYQEVFSYQPMAFQRRFEQDFLPWVASQHATFGLGSSAGEVAATYERLRAGLVAHPLVLPGLLRVDGNALDSLTAQALYSKDSFALQGWVLSALQAVQALRGGTGAPVPAGAAAHLAGLVRQLSPAGPTEAQKMQATFFATTCNDSPWTTDQDHWDALGDEQGARYPLLGYTQSTQVCAHWDRPGLELPAVTGAGLPPLLIVQSRHDPATAYEGALKTHAALGSSVLVTVEDEGDHGLYGTGNACVDDVVGAFLTDGEVPAGDVTCHGSPAPVASAPGGGVVAQVLRAARSAGLG